MGPDVERDSANHKQRLPLNGRGRWWRGGEGGGEVTSLWGIVGIEVPIILYTYKHARAHARCQSRYINAQYLPPSISVPLFRAHIIARTRTHGVN